MTKSLLTIALACAVWWLPAWTTAQERSTLAAARGATAATPADEPPDPGQLPPPLERISGNILDLEADGYFAVEGVEFGISPDGHEDRITWTIRVQKSLTCRHAVLRLKRLHDVRFYNTQPRIHQEIALSRLYHSPLIEIRAVNGDVLFESEEFEVWVPLTRTTVRRLNNQAADTVVFNRVAR
jgi:hypothetical protein